jgi:hypothetical protein
MIDCSLVCLLNNRYSNNAHENVPGLTYTVYALHLEIPHLSHAVINLTVITIIIKYFAGNDNCELFIYARLRGCGTARETD